MATLVSEQLRWLADQWENHCGYKSAVLSGIVPDRAHLDTGGYHCSVEDLKAHSNGNDYSNTRPDDRGHNPKHGAGVDMSMSPADMKRCYLRVKRVWDDKSDTRRRYLNAINTWKGSGDAIRLDFYANVTSWATPDHKWHNHGEVRRRWLRDWTAVRAIVSVLKGESHAQWLASQKTTTNPAAPTTPKGTTMSKAVVMEALNEFFTKQKVPFQGAPGERLTAAGWKPMTTAAKESYTFERLRDAIPVLASVKEANRKLDALAVSVGGNLPAEFAAIRADMTAQRDAIAAQLDDVRDAADVDETAVAAAVLASLTPEAIAAAIPAALTDQVADVLASRLTTAQG
ncbi:hypothetical protein [Melissospora conviva]|uniref:hypothetical protein n=1 Tax=Melissospora conviva TaxID=3388432 RepID=UPI003C1DB804